jgi:hypothetical protein
MESSLQLMSLLIASDVRVRAAKKRVAAAPGAIDTHRAWRRETMLAELELQLARAEHLDLMTRLKAARAVEVAERREKRGRRLRPRVETIELFDVDGPAANDVVEPDGAPDAQAMVWR